MERTCIKPILLSLTIFLQCASTSQQESVATTNDTLTIVSTPSEDVNASLSSPVTDESEVNSIDIDEFTKLPFENDYPYVKTLLREDGIIFTIIAHDTVHSEHRTIEFDSSRIEFLDSDPSYQDELGDLICSSDIRSPKFRFNQSVSIGMPQDEFLTRANLAESQLIKDTETNYSYYENKIGFEDDGHWKITIWFKNGFLVRIQSEINPCYYDYGD